jgi:serine/threonine protein kinase
VTLGRLRDWSGTVLDDRFEVERRAGSGGMGTVYRGRDLSTGQSVAIKFVSIVKGDRRVRFAREVELLASIEHPSIVRYIGDGEVEGQPFLVTEWLEGRSLGAQAREVGFTLAESVDVIWQLATALGHVHRAGIIHRDIKPSNVIFGAPVPGRVILIDFGIARSVDDMALTQMGHLVGTPGYFSPEQARGEPRLDARTDVFALGCLATLLMTGRSAYRGGSTASARMRVLLEQPAPLAHGCPEATPRLRAVIDEMLARDPADRLSDGDAVAAAIEALGPIPDGPRRRWNPDQDYTRLMPLSEIPTAIDRPEAASSPFLVTASPDEGEDDHADAAARLVAIGPGVEVTAIGRQCLVVRVLGEGSLARLGQVAAEMRRRLPGWPIIGALELESLDWAIGRLTVALVGAALEPDLPATLLLKDFD